MQDGVTEVPTEGAHPNEENHINSLAMDHTQQGSQDHELPTHQGLAALGQQHEKVLLKNQKLHDELNLERLKTARLENQITLSNSF